MTKPMLKGAFAKSLLVFENGPSDISQTAKMKKSLKDIRKEPINGTPKFWENIKIWSTNKMPTGDR